MPGPAVGETAAAAGHPVAAVETVAVEETAVVAASWRAPGRQVELAAWPAEDSRPLSPPLPPPSHHPPRLVRWL